MNRTAPRARSLCATRFAPRRRWLLGALVVVLSASQLVALPTATGSTIAPFEVDGNLADDSGPTFDWLSDPSGFDGIVTLDDAVSGNDSFFKRGSKHNQPDTWSCEIGKTPPKNDLMQSQFGIYEVGDGGDQHVAFNWTRLTTKGDAHIDIELNQSDLPNPACPELPRRLDGDILFTFDTERGGKKINVDVREWEWLTETKGRFVSLGLSPNDWDADINIPNTIEGLEPGAFGEAAISLESSGIGRIECGDFGSINVKTRSSTSVSAEIKDLIGPHPLDAFCPVSSLVKGVREAGSSDAFATDMTAEPGDTLEYQLVYANDGTGPATNVVISDVVRDHTSLVDCGSCTTDGDGSPGTTMTWTFPEVDEDDTVSVNFTVDLDDAFPAGVTEIDNQAEVDTDEELPRQSNEVTVTVNAAPAFDVTKVASPDQVSVAADPPTEITYTVTVTNNGNADGTTPVVDDYDATNLDIDVVNNNGSDDEAGQISWPPVALAANGGSAQFTYTAHAVGPFTGTPSDCGGQPAYPVLNLVTVTGDSAEEQVCVDAQPEFTIDKTANVTSALPGGFVNYTLTLRNVGDAPGSIVVTDTWDTARIASLSGFTPTPATVDPSAGVTTWPATSLNAGESATFTYTARLATAFSGDAGSGCSTNEFAVANLAEAGDASDTHTVCVPAEPSFSVAKTADRATVAPGGTIDYTIVVKNVGDAAGTTTLNDDYDETLVSVGNFSPTPNQHDATNGTIRWSDIPLASGASATFTYTATVIDTFVSGPPPSDCDPDEYAVVNTATVETFMSTATVCVPATPDLTITKASDAQGPLVEGDDVTYTLTYQNQGTAPATNVVIEENLPLYTEFVSCTGGCTQSGSPTSKATWTFATVVPGPAQSVTLTLRVQPHQACVICNTAFIDSDQTNKTPSNQVCLDATPGPDPSDAQASGSAVAADVFAEQTDLNQVIVDQTVAEAASSQFGPGTDADHSEESLSVVPAPTGDFLTAEGLQASSVSTVDRDPAAARQVSISAASNVSLVGGVVQIDAVRAVATAEATGLASSVSTNGSVLAGLVVDPDGSGAAPPIVLDEVAPNTRVDLDPTVFGPDSYVMLFEVSETTTGPAGQLSGGRYTADVDLSMVRVHITSLIGTQLDIVVGEASAHADFAQTILCDRVTDIQSVSGHAFIANGAVPPTIAATLGYVEIPTSGGSRLQTFSLGELGVDGRLVDVGAATASSTGSLGTGATSASSYAESNSVCILNLDPGLDPSGCTIRAEVMHAQANSQASPGARSSDAAGTVFTNLEIAGTAISAPVEPNTVVPIAGVGFAILNEQICDDGGTLDSGCADGAIPGHSGLTVRSVRLVVTNPLIGVGLEIIVNEAHADARYVAL